MECIPCNGECCRSTSLILGVTKIEIETILSEVKGNFEDYFGYYRDRKHIFIIKRLEDGRCVFLNENNKCRIHSYKPVSCKAYNYPACKELLENQ